MLTVTPSAVCAFRRSPSPDTIMCAPAVLEQGDARPAISPCMRSGTAECEPSEISELVVAQALLLAVELSDALILLRSQPRVAVGLSLPRQSTCWESPTRVSPWSSWLTWNDTVAVASVSLDDGPVSELLLHSGS